MNKASAFWALQLLGPMHNEKLVPGMKAFLTKMPKRVLRPFQYNFGPIVV